MHEWCIILLFCLILLSLSALAFMRKTSTLPINSAAMSAKSAHPVYLEVKIGGEVLKPGTYQLPPKATLRELLEQAEPLLSADLSAINSRRRIRDGETFHIAKRRPILIQVIGAVEEPGAVEILSGTRCCELAQQLKSTPEADLRAIRKKKAFLKEGDIIEIPSRKKTKGKIEKPARKVIGRTKNKKEKK